MVKAIDLIGSNSQLQNHWVRRFGAAIIDGFIMLVIMIIITAIMSIAALVIPLVGFLSSLLWSVIWFLYSAFLEGFMGSTLGKRFLNLNVVSIEGPMDIVKAVIRNLSKLFLLIIFLDWLVGFLTDGDPRQRLLDRFAGTTVVRTDIQEIYQGAFQPPTGPLPAPYSPGQSPQYPAQQPYPGAAPQPGPQPYQATQQQYPPSQAQDTTSASAVTQEGKVESDIGEAKSEFTRDELVNLRKDELMKICRERNLKISGTKRDLIDRILGEEIKY
ncbi:MAG: RDD family protein [Thermoplasmata archaeon]|nr:MAG: RDD family protein [Thermoplasmata archaeon]